MLVGEDGSVENRVVATPAGMPASTLVEAANYLNAQVRGRTLAEARADIERRARGGARTSSTRWRPVSSMRGSPSGRARRRRASN